MPNFRMKDPVTYKGRPARLITLPIRQDGGGHAIIMFDDGRAITVPVSDLVVDTKKETGRPNSEPVSI